MSGRPPPPPPPQRGVGRGTVYHVWLGVRLNVWMLMKICKCKALARHSSGFPHAYVLS